MVDFFNPFALPGFMAATNTTCRSSSLVVGGMAVSDQEAAYRGLVIGRVIEVQRLLVAQIFC